jgi:hypothetical protein
VSDEGAEAGQHDFHGKSAAKSVDHRKGNRHPLHWRIALVYDNGGKNEIYHGRTHDISVTGASIYVDHNIFLTEVVMLLAVPPLHIGKKETIIEIKCRMIYTVLDGEQRRFRIGIRFLHFKADGKKILTDILSKRVIPKAPQSSTSG